MIENEFKGNGLQSIDDVEFLDTSDVLTITEINEDIEADVVETDDGLYHATRMSEDEVKRIDDMWKESDDVTVNKEPYRASTNVEFEVEQDLVQPYKAHSLCGNSDISVETIEKNEATDIEQLGHMSDADIFSEYSGSQKNKYDSSLLDTLTEGLSKDELEYLKEGLASGDKEVYDYFGLNSVDDESDDEGFPRVRKL